MKHDHLFCRHVIEVIQETLVKSIQIFSQRMVDSSGFCFKIHNLLFHLQKDSTPLMFFYSHKTMQPNIWKFLSYQYCFHWTTLKWHFFVRMRKSRSVEMATERWALLRGAVLSVNNGPPLIHHSPIKRTSQEETRLDYQSLT